MDWTHHTRQNFMLAMVTPELCAVRHAPPLDCRSPPAKICNDLWHLDDRQLLFLRENMSGCRLCRHDRDCDAQAHCQTQMQDIKPLCPS